MGLIPHYYNKKVVFMQSNLSSGLIGTATLYFRPTEAKKVALLEEFPHLIAEITGKQDEHRRKPV